MACSCYQNVRNWIQAFLGDHDRIQNFIIILIYIQVGCSLLGSLGALYNGVAVINSVISLFGLVAIASVCESLIRTYAVLLFSAVLLDIAWFVFFSDRIWNMSSDDGTTGILFIISLRLTLAVEILGVCVRFFSSLLWIQVYRLGAAVIDSSTNAAKGAGSQDSVPSLTRSLLDKTLFDEDHINSLLGRNDGVTRNATGSCPDLSKIKSSPVQRALSFK